MVVLRLAAASFVLVSVRCYFSDDAWPLLSSSFAEVLTCHSEVMRHSLAPVCLVVPAADFVASAEVAAGIDLSDLALASFLWAIAAAAVAAEDLRSRPFAAHASSLLPVSAASSFETTFVHIAKWRSDGCSSVLRQLRETAVAGSPF